MTSECGTLSKLKPHNPSKDLGDFGLEDLIWHMLDRKAIL